MKISALLSRSKSDLHKAFIRMKGELLKHTSHVNEANHIHNQTANSFFFLVQIPFRTCLYSNQITFHIVLYYENNRFSHLYYNKRIFLNKMAAFLKILKLN